MGSLTKEDTVELTSWRRKLHTLPELSGQEYKTSAEVKRFLADTLPDETICGLGGTGVAFIFSGKEQGPTVMVRAELDALPIYETSISDHRSILAGRGHMCGHDGHMAILAGLSRLIARDRPRKGRAVVLFQPAEETGEGAKAVIADEKFSVIKPDYTFALHNLPGLALGDVRLKEGVANCASRGMLIKLSGRTAHASMPETGISPSHALARLIPAFALLNDGRFGMRGFALATLTHVEMGAQSFGVAPGQAELWVTLRTMTDKDMYGLVLSAESLVAAEAASHGLSFAISYHDIFSHSENNPSAVKLLRRALDAERILHHPGEAMRASEDFGQFGRVSQSAMFFLGAGLGSPSLHNPDYDFPDELIPIGSSIFARVLEDMLG